MEILLKYGTSFLNICEITGCVSFFSHGFHLLMLFQIVSHHEDLLSQATGVEKLEGDYHLSH